jgi:hypothetical protein
MAKEIGLGHCGAVEPSPPAIEFILANLQGTEYAIEVRRFCRVSICVNFDVTRLTVPR